VKNFSIFEYYYCDASNYKSWGSLLLRGVVAKAEVELLLKKFDSACCFIAEQLGIPPLYSELWAFSNGPSDDDHVWHTFHVLRHATEQDTATPIFCTLAELIQKVKAVNAWDETLSPHWGI
jgi:hypothetical protein